MMGHGYYILDDDKNVVPCDDLIEWGRWIEDRDNKIVCQEYVGDVFVSTVFLGIDHSWTNYRTLGAGVPIVFESMIFGGRFDQEQSRYATYEEALQGHIGYVEQVRAFTPKRRRWLLAGERGKWWHHVKQDWKAARVVRQMKDFIIQRQHPR